MKILDILEALEIPHAIFSTGTGLIGVDNYITTHKDFRKILAPLGFVVHKQCKMLNRQYITRDLNRDEYGQFKAAAGKYKVVSDDTQGLVYERTRRQLKEYLPKK